MKSVRHACTIRASLLSRIESVYTGTEGGCERPMNHTVGTIYISAPSCAAAATVAVFDEGMPTPGGALDHPRNNHFRIRVAARRCWSG